MEYQCLKNCVTITVMVMAIVSEHSAKSQTREVLISHIHTFENTYAFVRRTSLGQRVDSVR